MRCSINLGLAAMLMMGVSSLAVADPSDSSFPSQPYGPSPKPYDPNNLHGCNPTQYTKGWNQKYCKNIGHSYVQNHHRWWIQNYDGTFLYSDHPDGNQPWYDHHLMTEACRHGNKGYKIWMSDPQKCDWNSTQIVY